MQRIEKNGDKKMLVFKENERLYLKSWNYNAACIVSELAKIVINNGGRVKPTYHAIISNRTIDSAIKDYLFKLERLTNIINEGHGTEKTKIAIEYVKKELEDMEAINNDPITVSHTSYISFTLNGYYYYYQVDDNPFFEFHYIKTPISNNKCSRDAALVEEKKDWLEDCFLKINCSKDDIIKAASQIFNMLVSADQSPIVRDKTRRRVPNTYNGGYHYETIYSPERFENVNF